MATIQDIKKQLTDEWMANETVQQKFGFVAGASFDNTFSSVSIINIIFYIVAFGFYLFTQVLSTSKTDITTMIANMKPHTIPWYISKIKAFQLGDILPTDTDIYLTIDDTKQIVKYCSINEQKGYLAIKVAGENNGVPEALPVATLNAVIAYMNRIKDAGVHYTMISRSADLYRASLRIYYDALILQSNGARIDGTNTNPIQEAVENYLKSMPFDSRYSNMALIDSLQNVEGVKIADVVKAEAKYAANSYIEILSVYIPDAGYMSLDSLNIEYIPY